MIKFYNVYGGETAVIPDDLDDVITEARIAAYYNSSDQNVNGLVQDFGWRIAPETLKRVHEIQKDNNILTEIAASYQVRIDLVTVPHILLYISRQDRGKHAESQERTTNNYQREYDRQVRAIAEEADLEEENEENEGKPAPQRQPRKAPAPKAGPTAAQLAAQKAKNDAKLAEMLDKDKENDDNKNNT